MVQCLQRGSEKVKTTIFELELMKTIDCFFDCHGNYDSKLVSFRKKSLYQTKFFPTGSKSIQKIQNDTQNEFPKQKFQVMSLNKIFTTGQISN